MYEVNQLTACWQLRVELREWPESSVMFPRTFSSAQLINSAGRSCASWNNRSVYSLKRVQNVRQKREFIIFSLFLFCILTS